VALLAVPAIASLEGCAPSRALTLEPAEGTNTIDVPLSSFAKSNTVNVTTKRLTDPLLVVKSRRQLSRAAAEVPAQGRTGQPQRRNAAMRLARQPLFADGAVTKGPANSGLKTFPTKDRTKACWWT
jgi:hypothetical protein